MGSNTLSNCRSRPGSQTRPRRCLPGPTGPTGPIGPTTVMSKRGLSVISDSFSRVDLFSHDEDRPFSVRFLHNSCDHERIDDKGGEVRTAEPIGSFWLHFGFSCFGDPAREKNGGVAARPDLQDPQDRQGSGPTGPIGPTGPTGPTRIIWTYGIARRLTTPPSAPESACDTMNASGSHSRTSVLILPISRRVTTQ